MTYIQPLFPLLVLAALVEAFRGIRQRRVSWLLRLLVLGIFLFSWYPAARLVSHAFEGRYPPREFPVADDAQAIVVLSSAIYPPSPPIPTPRVGSDTYERCMYTAWLYRHWRPLPVLAAGGTNHPPGEPYSVTMAVALEMEGVPKSHIWLETESHSTHENAAYSARLLRSKGIRKIILVTEAYHMFRAERCFRKEGIEVTPAACAYRTFNGFHFTDLLPGWEPISWNEDILHESIGLLWYRMRGWI
jgi:uncharacterized SAM-binding protein YcdF (DUF218 family)